MDKSHPRVLIMLPPGKWRSHLKIWRNWSLIKRMNIFFYQVVKSEKNNLGMQNKAHNI